LTKVIYFDLCAVIIMLPVFFSSFRKHINYGIANRWFILFAGTVLYTSIADVAAVGFDLLGEGYVIPKYIAHTAYLMGRAYVTPVIVAYLFSRVGLWYRFKNYSRSVLVYMLPVVCLEFVILLVNPFSHVIFYLNENDQYMRGPFMYVMYILSILYALAGYYLMAKYRKALGTRKTVYLLLVFSLAMISTAVQFVFPYLIIECFVLAAMSIILLLGVQAPEERMYEDTSILKLSAFNEDILIAQAMNAETGLILAAVTNIDAILELLPYESFFECIDVLYNKFHRKRKEINAYADFYYLGRGCFAVVSIGQDDGILSKLTQAVNDIFMDDINVDDMEIRFITNVCYAKLPKDISHVKDILPFAEKLKERDYTGEIRYAEKSFDKKEYDVRRNIEAIINRAVDSGAMYLMYQPVYSVEKERYVSAEAFLRLKDPVYGDIPPQIVVAEAERYGAINGVTTYLFEELCRFISGPEFLQLNLEWMEINLSPIQLNWKDLTTVFVSTMESYHVNPSNICINIVDEADAQAYSQMYENLNTLKELGIKIYMDDFGAGIFEIERITTLPLDGIKLDRDFIRMGIREDAMLVLENSVNMIRDMQLDVVAVGVEDLIMRRRLVEMNCLKQQGYYYAKPMTKKEMIRFTVGLPRIKQAEEV